MEVQFGPNSVEEPNLLYKLQSKIKVFNTDIDLPNRGYNLVASSSKYGLVFVGVPSGTLSVYHLYQLIKKDCEKPHMCVKLNDQPTYMSVSCDHELLALSGNKILFIYKVEDFQKPTKIEGFKNAYNVAPSITIKYDNHASYVTAMQWNPSIPDSIALAFYDGTLLTCQASSGQVKQVQSNARCICWSPKGKQLVTGNSDGSLHQFKPDLTPAKAIPAPNLFNGSPVEALAVYWISTYQFAVVYKNSADNSRPSFTIVNTPKVGQPSCLNYEDICYSTGSTRPWYYYLHRVALWNMVLAASSNSMEMATIGSTDDGANWLQWCQSDEARPELPLTDKKQENYPVGICFDTCAIHQLPWGENESLPHMPLLLAVSQTGILTIFNVINLNKQAPQVCIAPKRIVLPAHALNSDIPGEEPKSEETTVSIPKLNSQPTSQPNTAQPANFNTSHAPSLPNVASTSQVNAPTAIKVPSFALSSMPNLESEQKPAMKSALAVQLQPTSQPNTAQPASFNTSHAPSLFNVASTSQVNAPTAIKVPSFALSSMPNLVSEQKPAEKSALAVQLQANTDQPKPQPSVPEPKPTPEDAALKAEQDKINKAKDNQELKNILVKEVNDFQNELYNFMLKTRATQARIQRDIENINSNFSFNTLDTEQLKKECSIDELRNAIVQLKLELVRACAVIAEARTHSNAREFHEWSQADPLTTKRVSSVKKLAYYVQTQLDQAQKALDYKWSEAAKEHDYNMPGKRMIRPILDDVYQPLVKQQEILSRQQAVLRTLRKTLNECDIGPVFKSTSLLRSTPFRKDPLSKLTKNILNMSIEPQNQKQTKGILTTQKLELLKDVLSNHKTVKIKPVNIELRQHFETMREKYERQMMEKTAQAAMEALKTEAVKAEPPKYKHAGLHQQTKTELKAGKQVPVKQDPISLKQPVSAPSATPLTNVKPAPNINNVVRTLFTDEPKPETKPLFQQPTKPFTFTQQAASPNTKSVLKDLLQTKSQANPLGHTNDITNLFLGQKICSPTGISQPPKKVLSAKKRIVNTDVITNVLGSSAPTLAPSSMFPSKPISEMTNMFQPSPTSEPTPFEPPASKPATAEPTPKPFGASMPKPTFGVPTSKPTPFEAPKPKAQSSETGEPESNDAPKPFDLKTNMPMKNLFGMKPTSTSTPVPDLVKTSQEKVTVKPDKLPEESKENVPKTDDTKKKQEVEPLGDLKTESKVESKSEKSDTQATTDSHVTTPTTVSKPSASATLLTTPPTETTTPPKSDPEKTGPASSLEKPAEDKSTASSLFGAAVASQPKPGGFSQSSSIFASNAPSVFGGKPMFGSTLTGFGQTPSATSVFGSASESAASSTESIASTASITETSTVKTEAGSTPTSATSSSSIFSTAAAFSSTPSSVFGQASATFPTTSAYTGTTTTDFGVKTTSVDSASSTASSVFSSASQAFGKTPTTQPESIFGTTTQAPVFGTASTSVFGTAQTAQSSVFESASETTQATVFGSPTQTTQASVFGSSTQTTQASLFGSPQTTHSSIFGTPTLTTQASVFGTPTQTTQASMFGTPTQTTQASVFGTPTQTTQASVFGTPTQTTQASVFGTPTQTTQASVFGTPTQTTQASVFGTPTQTTQASLFGTPTQTTQASLFGTPTQTTQSSVFGTSTPTTQASIFGAPAASSGSLFGGSEANLFASASISTTSAPTGTSGGNIFGGSSSGSVFGGGNVFGGKAFGQNNSTAASIFGGAAFGQKPANNLWAGGTSSGGFGSTGFGQQTTPAPSVFGGGTGSFSAPSGGAFSTPQQAPAFGSGESQPSSIFGTPQQPPAPGAFGGSPSFGAKPSFGQPASFGSPTSGSGFGGFGGGFNKSPTGFGAPPAFGGGATFGGNAFGSTSPSQVFGGAAASFGSPTQQSNATFENLATQNTLTFGSLAQSPQQQQPPSFNTSPSFTGWRG